MGPDQQISNASTEASAFLDPKIPLSTNGQGSQVQLRRWKHVVYTWVKLHKSWASSKLSQALLPERQGFVLLRVSQRRAKALCRNLSDQVIGSTGGVQAIAECVLQSNADSDLQYQIGIMDKIHSMYRRDGQRMSEYTMIFKSLIEKYIEVAGPLSERMNEFFALELLRRAGLEPGLRATVLTSALQLTTQERQVQNTKAWYSNLVSTGIQPGQAASSSSSDSQFTEAAGAVSKICEIKALIKELPRQSTSPIAKVLKDTSNVAAIVRSIPTTGEARTITEEEEDEQYIVPAVTDEISSAHRKVLLDRMRLLRVRLDNTSAEFSYSLEQTKAISSNISKLSDELKKLVLDMASNTSPLTVSAINQTRSVSAPARVIISAVCGALAPLDVLSDGKSTAVMFLFGGGPRRFPSSHKAP